MTMENFRRNRNWQSWLLVIALWLAFCLDFADRQVVFSMFPILKSQLGFTDPQLGLTSSLFLWLYAICSPFAGYAGDRFPKSYLIAASLIVWSGLTALTGLAGSPSSLLSCRVGIGIAESVFYPSAVAMIAYALPSGTRSRAFALFNSGNVFGVVLGGWTGGWFAQKGIWRLAFYSLGIAGTLYAIALLLACLRFGKDPLPVNRRQSKTPALSALRVPTYVILCGVFGTFAFVNYLMYAWLPTLLQGKFSLGLADAGFTATAYIQMGSVPGLLLGAWIADRLFAFTRASRLWVLAVASLLAAPSTYWIANAHSLLGTKFGALGLGFCTGMYLANLFAAAFDVIAPEVRASAAGLMNFAGSCVAGFSGVLGGVLQKRIGIAGVMTNSAGCCLVTCLVVVGGMIFWFARDYADAHAVIAEDGRLS
jgi:MFS family permease